MYVEESLPLVIQLLLTSTTTRQKMRAPTSVSLNKLQDTLSLDGTFQ